MAKIQINPLASTYNLDTALNLRLQQIEDTLNDNVLWRDGFVGEPNQMEVDLDMNGGTLLNVSEITSGGVALIELIEANTTLIETNTLNIAAIDARVTTNEADIEAIASEFDSKEDYLGNPELDGHILSSTAAGVRSWVEMSEGTTDHTLLSNIGTNTHDQIDTHIGDSTVHFTQAEISIPKSQISDFGVTAGDVDAEASTDGFVLTSDGAGNAVWEAVGGGNNWLTANAATDFTVDPAAAGIGAVALGDGAISSATYAIALGQIASATSNSCISIGTNARTLTGFNAIAMSTDALASGSAAIAIGTATDATGTKSIAIGNGTQAIADQGIAIGDGADANAIGSVALGRLSQADLLLQTVVGPNILASSVTSDVAYSLKAGYGTGSQKNLLHLYGKGKLELYGTEAQYVIPGYATGSIPVTTVTGGMIYDTTTSELKIYDGGWNAIGGGGGGGEDYVDINSTGTLPVATGLGAIAIGPVSAAAGGDSIAIGSTAIAARTGQISIGSQSGSFTGTNGDGAIAIGDNAKIRGIRDIAIGYQSSIQSGDRSICIGSQNTVSTFGEDTVLLGRNSAVTQLSQNSIGSTITASSVTSDVPYSTKIGFGSSANLNYNLLHLYDKGKLELYGSEAQYVIPSYATASIPATAITGGMVYDSDTGQVKVYDGGWNNVGGAEVILGAYDTGTFPASPVEGTSIFDRDLKIVYTYDGTAWYGFSSGGGGIDWAEFNGGTSPTIAPSAPGTNSIAIGNDTYSGIGYSNTVIGVASEVTGGNSSVVIGDRATVTNSEGVAIGRSVTSGTDGVAIGRLTDCNSNGVSIGNDCNTLNVRSVAIGSECTASSTSSVVIGAKSSAALTTSVSIGYTNIATLAGQTYVGHQITSANLTSAGVTTSAQEVVLGNADNNVATRNFIHCGGLGVLTSKGANAQFQLPEYTVATLPTGSSGGMVAVTDETGGYIPAFFDGTNWRRVTDRAIVS